MEQSVPLDVRQPPRVSVQLQVVHFDHLFLQQHDQLAGGAAEQRVQRAGLRAIDVDDRSDERQHLRRSALQLCQLLHLRGKRLIN